ncbi:NADPH-dependent oxidoreductase [Inquilinus limosus]|uniref:NADPH-dependent oxidoreductase n=1 Tax=Inquilinus limosus TaxID=171674 RepID=A0A211ZV94_9PROT|nr:NADPH-dependent oxidoreductase [Inquilinus limosus]OWJ69134.1 NADPH-dependent oxidoreductase [Inquilinus limosus]
MTDFLATTSAGETAERLLAARYGDDAPAAAIVNDVTALLLGHRSVRAFLPDALPDGTIETLVAAAQSASTSSNLQAWSVVAVEDAAHKGHLASLAGNQDFIRQAPLFLVWLADFARLHRLADAQAAAVDGAAYTEAFILGVVDAALAAQNAVVALESLGLGTVYVGAVRNHPDEIARALAVPGHVFPVFGLAVGWPDPASPASVKPRLPQRAVLHRETYDPGPQADAASDYDATLKAFWRGQGLGRPPWTRQVVNRLRDSEALHGRDRIRDSLNRLGFPLR